MADLNKFLGGGGGSLSNQQIFTTSANFTVPSNVYVVYVSGCGGGAGGSSGRSSQTTGINAANGAGGGACALFVPIPVTPNEVIPVTVGAKGIGATGPTGRDTSIVSGNGGGDSRFKSLLLRGGMTNGNGGGVTFLLGPDVAIMNGPSGSADAPVSSVTGFTYTATTLNPVEYPAAISGEPINNVAAGSGAGGSSYFGQGGNGRNPVEDTNGLNGFDATGYGAGGGAGGLVYNALYSRVAGSGGDGSQGVIIINW